MAEQHFTGGNGAIWMQPSGPATDMVYLGCHDIASIDEPLGDYTPFFCPDPSKPKAWVPSGETFAAPEAVTADILEDVTDALSYLESQKCPFPVYINMVCNGRKDVFTNYRKTYILDVRKITNRSYANLAQRDGDERAEVTHSLSASPPLIKVVDVTAVRQTLPATSQSINDIFGCTDESCGGQCDTAVSLCENLIVGADGEVAASADVIYTNDNGTTWTDAAAQPFAVDENIESVTCFAKDNTTTRWIAVRATDSTTNAEIGYSDDGGATWTNVDVESSGSFLGANDAGALFALDTRHIWLVLTGGYIVFSSDGGLTWTTQDAGVLTAGDYNAVHFADTDNGYAVADSGIVVKTDDGGNTWAAATAITGTPDVLCVHVFDADNAIVGDNGGDMWRTFDGGTTWTQLYTGVTAVNDITFVNDFVGWAVDGVLILRTRNGGEDWETVANLSTFTELNAVWACDENLAYVVGEDGSNAGAVYKVA